MGKSAFVESLASPEFPVYTLIASIHDPTDFSGLPVYDTATGQVRFAVPHWVAQFSEHGQGVLFLDELSTAPPAVQSALLRVVLERRVGDHRLPEGVRVVAAANPPDMVATGWDITAPLANRFVHLQWQLSAKAYLDGLGSGFLPAKLYDIPLEAHTQALSFWRMVTVGLLRQMPHLLQSQPGEGEYAFATPRTWEMAIYLMAGCDLLGLAPRPGMPGGGAFIELMAGTLGRGVSTSLAEYLVSLRLPDVEKLLRGEQEADFRALREDEVYILFAMVGATLTRYYQQYLQKRRRDGQILFEGISRFVSLCEQVSQANKLDAGYVPIRHVLTRGLFQQALSIAHRMGEDRQLSERIRRVFGEGIMADYVEVLGFGDGSQRG